jgi:hypothetical protein
MLIREEYNVKDYQDPDNEEELYRQKSEITKLIIPAPNGIEENDNYIRLQSDPVIKKS